MKTVVMIFAILFFVNVKTHGDQLPGDDVTKAINAEVQLTREKLENVSSQLGGLPGNPYADSDYSRLSKIFKNNTDQALYNYNSTLKHSLLPKIQYWLNRYTSLASSSSNSTYLNDAAALIQRRLDKLQSEYKSIIMQLYFTALGDVPLYLVTRELPGTEAICGPFKIKNGYDKTEIAAAQKPTVSITFTSDKELVIPEATLGCDGSYLDYDRSMKMLSFYNKKLIDKAIDDTAIAQAVARVYDYGCTSQVCRKLRRADDEQFLVLISNLVDQPMKFTVLGREFNVANSGIEVIKPPPL